MLYVLSLSHNVIIMIRDIFSQLNYWLIQVTPSPIMKYIQYTRDIFLQMTGGWKRLITLLQRP